MERFAEAERWLSEAEWDLDTAQILHNSKKFNASAFYSQQSAEKAVKAALYGLGEIPVGHSVREMLERFHEVSGIEVRDLLTSARELDRHYIPSRYPNAHPSGSPHEAYDEEVSERTLNCAQVILEFMKKSIERLKKGT